MSTSIYFSAHYAPSLSYTPLLHSPLSFPPFPPLILTNPSVSLYVNESQTSVKWPAETWAAASDPRCCIALCLPSRTFYVIARNPYFARVWLCILRTCATGLKEYMNMPVTPAINNELEQVRETVYIRKDVFMYVRMYVCKCAYRYCELPIYITHIAPRSFSLSRLYHLPFLDQAQSLSLTFTLTHDCLIGNFGQCTRPCSCLYNCL